MSSPLRRSDRSRSGSSRARVNGFHHGPHDSPNGVVSAHFLEDLGHLFIDDERELHKQLDERALEQQRRHITALEEALAKYNANRKQAEDVLERHYLELEQERLRRAQEEAQKKEEARRKLEEERRKKEELEHQIAARREQEEAQRAAGQKKRDDEERARQQAAKEREEAEKKSREQAAAQEAASRDAEARRQAQASQQQPQPPPAQTNGVPSGTNSQAPPAVAAPSSNALPSGIVSSVDQRRQMHASYLDIHRRLKELRTQVDGLKRTDPALKDLSDWRHELRTRINQISRTDREGNKATILRVQQTLDRALPFAQKYAMDASGFFIKNPKGDQPVQGNAILLFLLNHFAKLFFGLIERDVLPLSPRERSQAADHVGNMAVQIFAVPKYQAENTFSFIDVLWAKYHRKVPLLFGVRGGEQDEMTIPLASVYASMCLRDFRNSRALPRNPAPARLFWEALARVLNTPTAQQTLIHFQILTGLLHETAIPRFIAFYGQVGIATLRHAVLEFPKTAPANPQAQREAEAIRTLATAFETDLHLTL